ncbi:DUF58 domain-containing protein [Terriglobus roseus]|uniref:Uncharacterized conserved protein, DUF58 family, contains vWF domain n=1 Tax=Terriglobus roseus TaxID=392734 RepID=A0A1H4KFI4_9BACT|nr:DUF58 domain-containing protein [Terriglobus roseus]SEB57026.1 Uncharacterized conserved protein, DUF58 family, contains vWF domain [Terriglobus roseus]
MQTLIPTPVTHRARAKGRRLGRALGFGLTPRALLLLGAAILLAVPAFLHGSTPWLMFGVDALLFAAMSADAVLLPAPERFVFTRTFVHAPELGHPVDIEITAVKSAAGLHSLLVTDDLHASMLHLKGPARGIAYPNEPTVIRYAVTPSARGDVALGQLYVRYRSVLGLAERWAIADLRQTVRVYASGEGTSEQSDLFLMRARQIELEKRRLRRIGLGREFETMRDYQTGDEMRNISWTATARHNRLITQQFTTERSQQVWMVIDAGRLSRTAFELPCEGAALDVSTSVVTQLDQATSAAGQLARVVAQSGDRYGLLAYGRGIQQQLLPGSGALHLRRMIDALSQVRSERAEADHMLASSRLRQLQRRRGLVLWVTEMTESAGRPEIVAAVIGLVKRHLVVLILLQHRELEALAGNAPADARGMYASAAAQEMLERRRITVAQLRASGVLVVETSAAGVAAATISKYLEIKAQGRL